jgi:hypothetical protein
LGTGQGLVVVGVPRWYTDGRDDDIVSAVGTDCVYRDRVCQWSWRWYRAMVHWMHHHDATPIRVASWDVLTVVGVGEVGAACGEVVIQFNTV